MNNGWICDRCGAVAEGTMCMSCGNQRALESPVGPEAGSYWSIVGFRNMEGFKAYGWYLGLMLVMMGVLLRQWVPLAVVTGLVAILLLPTFFGWLAMRWFQWRRAR